VKLNELRLLPSVDKLLKTSLGNAAIGDYGRPQTIEAIRVTLEEIRESYKSGEPLPEESAILEQAIEKIRRNLQYSLVEVINATGVIIHTNLGRAPLAKSASQAIVQLSHGYTNLEFDLTTGKRGSRTGHAESLLTQLTGAEAALVVNNNAAAVLLCLSALAKRRSVVISRTQLIEIGGGFRVPDVMKQSGAKLIEIGTTNRVHLQDYREALEKPAAMILHAHRSNFQLVGFTDEPTIAELSSVAKEYNVLLMDDQGSGALINTQQFGLTHEPTVQESLQAGSDIVCFSGDKLLGGPQAGIIVGKFELINIIKNHALARAVRADKTCLAALTATLLHFLKDSYIENIPIWQMIARTKEQTKDIATTWQNSLGGGDVVETFSTIGGGSIPGEKIPTFNLSIGVPKPDKFLKILRNQTPPIIARIEGNRVLFDPRTVLIDQEEAFLNGLRKAIHRMYPNT